MLRLVIIENKITFSNNVNSRRRVPNTPTPKFGAKELISKVVTPPVFIFTLIIKINTS